MDFEGDVHSEDHFSDDDGEEMDLESAFWAENIAANGKVEIDTIPRQITLTSVALSGAKGDTTIYVKVADTKYTLCTLSGACPQFRLNLTFGSSESPVEFGVTGPGSVTLLGEQRLMFNGDELNFDSDEEMEEEEEEKVEKTQGGKGPKKEETQAQQSKGQQQGKQQQPKQQQQKKEGNQAQPQKKENQQPKQQQQGKQQQQPKKEGNQAQNQAKKEQQPQQSQQPQSENGSKNKNKKKKNNNNNNNNNGTTEGTKTDAVTPKAKTEEKQGTPSAKRVNPSPPLPQNGEQTGTKKQKTNEQKANE